MIKLDTGLNRYEDPFSTEFISKNISKTTGFGLKNFRVFDHKQGATFNLAPLTILTGCNSSGKSSVVKAMVLLQDFFEQLRTQNIADCKLDFGNKLTKLGSFDIARNCNSRKGSKMTFTYTVRPDNIDKDLRVRLTFGTEKEDALNNGYLTSAIITDTTSGDTVFEIEKVENRYQVKVLNMNPITIDFMRHALKAVILDKAYYTKCTGEKTDADGRPAVYPTKEDLKPLNELLQIAASYLTDEAKTKALIKRAENILGHYHHCDGPVREIEFLSRQVVSTAKTGLLFSLPFWEDIYSLPKSDVRNLVMRRIEERYSSEVHTIPSKIESMLADFESSKHNTLGEYLKEKEVDFLNFIEPKDFVTFFPECSHIKKLSYREIGRFLRQNCGERSNSGWDFGRINYAIIDVAQPLIPQAELIIDKQLKTPIEDQELEYKLFVQLRGFYTDVILQSLLPNKFCNFGYMGDSAITLQRLYTSEVRDEFGRVLFNYLDASLKNEWIDINAGDFVNKWVKKFGLGDHISISLTAEGLGVVIKLHKTADDRQGRLLADEGFGITKLIGIMLNIETAIFSAKSRKGGYFVLSDVKRHLPRIARVDYTLAVEEPENHLHPRYQALLAEMFADAYKNYDIHFIVETHSEYMVRKLQTLVAKKELTPAEVSLQYVYNADPEKRPKGKPQVKSIEIRVDGVLRDSFGPGFFDEADNLAMDLLKE